MPAVTVDDRLKGLPQRDPLPHFHVVRISVATGRGCGHPTGPGRWSGRNLSVWRLRLSRGYLQSWSHLRLRDGCGNDLTPIRRDDHSEPEDIRNRLHFEY